MSYVNVRPEVVSCAVRYALGRRSYVVGTITDQVRSTWNDLGEQQKVIYEDVRSWLVSAQVAGNEEADEYDTWLELWRWCARTRMLTTPAARPGSDHA